MSSYDFVVVGSWTPEQVGEIKAGLASISESSRIFKTKQLQNEIKCAAVQSIMSFKDFTKFVKVMELVSANVASRSSVVIVSKDENDALGSMADLSSSLSSISNEPSDTIAKKTFNMFFQAISAIDGAPLNGVQTYPYAPPFSALEAFSHVVKNITALAVVHVEGNRIYNSSKVSDVEAFSKLILSGGDHTFKVVVQLAMKAGGTPEKDPTQEKNPSPMFNYLTVGLGNLEFRGMCAAHTPESLLFLSQVAKMKDNAKKLGIKEKTSIKFVEHAWGSTTEGEVMFFNITKKQLDEIMAPVTFDVGPYFDGEEVTAQFNIASNGTMLPRCVSIVTEKSSTLRDVLQDRDLAVPEDCMVMGFGVPVDFNVDTAFGDVVTKNMTFELVHRRRGGAPSSFVCPITKSTMSDPVFTSDGHCFEREAIQEWLKTKSTSPLTGLVLEHKRLTPAWAVKSAIEEDAACNGGGAAADDKEMSDEEMSTEEASSGSANGTNSNTVRLVPEDSDSAESSDEEEGGGAAAAQGHSMDLMADGAPSTWYPCDRADFVHFYKDYFLPFTAKQAASVEWTSAQKRAHYRQWAANPDNQWALKHEYDIQLSGNSSNEDILNGMHKLAYVPKDKRASYRQWLINVEKNDICDGQNLPRGDPQVREVDSVYNLYNTSLWSSFQDDAP